MFLMLFASTPSSKPTILELTPCVERERHAALPKIFFRIASTFARSYSR
jgi:hypothetical protein